jgi:sugar phosphate isomerase/epimerase
MRVGICEWTTFPASFEDELAAYRAAGAGAIGILEFKLDGVDDVRGTLRETGLAVSACLPAGGSILPSPVIPGPEEPEARVESICRSIARFAELEASWVLLPADVGILFDTWHLSEVSHVGRIRGVHVSDRTRPETRSNLDRALPGDDSRAAVRALEAGRSDGWYDVEVMSDDGTFGDAFPDSLWALPVDETARRAVAAMEAL